MRPCFSERQRAHTRACRWINVGLPLPDKSSPLTSETFFGRPNDPFLSLVGFPGLLPTKWVGKGNKGGCKIWFDCGSNSDKASCQAQGGIVRGRLRGGGLTRVQCVWNKFAVRCRSGKTANAPVAVRAIVDVDDERSQPVRSYFI